MTGTSLRFRSLCDRRFISWSIFGVLAGAAALAQALVGWGGSGGGGSTVRRLNLARNRIGVAGVRSLAGSLPHSALRWLNLGYNPVGDGGARWLAAALGGGGGGGGAAASAAEDVAARPRGGGGGGGGGGGADSAAAAAMTPHDDSQSCDGSQSHCALLGWLGLFDCGVGEVGLAALTRAGRWRRLEVEVGCNPGLTPGSGEEGRLQ
jgi:hypothetical protein